jgi:hypothetical protein
MHDDVQQLVEKRRYREVGEFVGPLQKIFRMAVMMLRMPVERRK